MLKNELNILTLKKIMLKAILISTVMLLCSLQSFWQYSGITFQEVQKQGNVMKQLNSIYQSAFYDDT